MRLRRAGFEALCCHAQNGKLSTVAESARRVVGVRGRTVRIASIATKGDARAARLPLSPLPSDPKAIAVSGELDQTSLDRLDALIQDAEETDIRWIVVDLSDVSFIDSTGLSMLLDARRRSNGRLSYMPSKHDGVTRLLEVTGTIE